MIGEACCCGVLVQRKLDLTNKCYTYTNTKTYTYTYTHTHIHIHVKCYPGRLAKALSGVRRTFIDMLRGVIMVSYMVVLLSTCCKVSKFGNEVFWVDIFWKHFFYCPFWGNHTSHAVAFRRG
jgi:hypothetical protein